MRTHGIPQGADMSDYTPEEIEAAAKAIHDTVEAQYVKAGMRLTWGSKQQGPTTRECYREQARAALAAADNDARERGIARVDTQNEATIEQLAQEAFWSDDLAGHHKPGPLVYSPYTWENIPE